MNMPSASQKNELGFAVDDRISLSRAQLESLENEADNRAAQFQTPTRTGDALGIEQGMATLQVEMENTNVEMKKVKALLEQINRGIQDANHQTLLQEQRANYQHQMLFNAVKKVAQDVKGIKGSIASTSENEGVEVDETPSLRSPGKTRATENRQNIERIMYHHLHTMHSAKNVKELKQAGDLAVKYADELFKSFLG